MALVRWLRIIASRDHGSPLTPLSELMPRRPSTLSGRIIGVLAIVAAVAGAGAPAATAAVTVQAEALAMRDPSGGPAGSAVADVEAVEGRALRLEGSPRSVGGVSVAGRTRSVGVRLRATSCAGRPWVSVRLGGQLVTHGRLSPHWISRTMATSLAPGRRELTVSVTHADPVARCRTGVMLDQIVLGERAPRDSAALRDLRLETVVAGRVNEGRPSRPDHPSGAMQSNARYVEGTYPSWNISYQNVGESRIVEGLARDDAQSIEDALTIFEWGLARQEADGGFSSSKPVLADPGTSPRLRAAAIGSLVHNTSFFMQALAHSVLLLEASPHADRYASRIARYRRALERMSAWMSSEAVWPVAAPHNAPYAHRFYLEATALALAGRATGDLWPVRRVPAHLRAGLARQLPSGVNPEAGGADTGYQAGGPTFATRYLTYFPRDRIAPSLERMIRRAVQWEVSRIDPATGRIATRGNTRTCAAEYKPLGQRKEPSYPGIARMLQMRSLIEPDLSLATLAELVMEYRASGAPRCHDL